MDATAFIQSDVTALADTFDVYRVDDNDTSSAYDNGTFTDTGVDVHVRVHSPSSQQQVVAEGSGQETSYTGFLVPEYDVDGNLAHNVEVNDQLRMNGKRYDVVVKDGIPNDHDPEIWRLGLDKANQSG